MVTAIYHGLASVDLSTRVQMSSAYPLPVAYPDYGFQEGPLLTLWFPHFRVLLLCPTRSLFRVVGSSSRMDGGIISYGVPQLSWRLRVARGSLEEPTKSGVSNSIQQIEQQLVFF